MKIDDKERIREVKVVSHDRSWSLKYRKEASKLKKLFADKMHSVHHIGSTAIPKSFAKPIVDILILVFSIEEVDSFNSQMKELGYIACGEYGISNRRFFYKDDGGARSCHLHVFSFESKEAYNHLIFRDYLNNYPDEAKVYSVIKQKLASKYSNDIEAYVNEKSKHVEELLIKIEASSFAKDYDPLKDRVQLSLHNPDWTRKAHKEICQIKEADHKKVIVDIQHIGSTSIKGILAKPILDIMIGVDLIEHGQELIGPLEKMDYLFWSDNPDKTKMFFVKGMPPKGSQRSHHVHIVPYNDSRWQMRILFRDYLNENPKVALEYTKLKEELCEFYAYDRENYTLFKSNFVEQTLRKAGYSKKVHR